MPPGGEVTDLCRRLDPRHSAPAGTSSLTDGRSADVVLERNEGLRWEPLISTLPLVRATFPVEATMGIEPLYRVLQAARRDRIIPAQRPCLAFSRRSWGVNGGRLDARRRTSNSGLAAPLGVDQIAVFADLVTTTTTPQTALR